MKNKLLILSLFALTLLGCDPSESFDAIIANSAQIDVKAHFVSKALLSQLPYDSEVLTIQSGSSQNYQRIGADSGIGLARLTSLAEFDSIYITNTSDKVLKIYKEGTPGKNIYNVDEYWTVSKPSKSHFVYTYEITDEDIE